LIAFVDNRSPPSNLHTFSLALAEVADYRLRMSFAVLRRVRLSLTPFVIFGLIGSVPFTVVPVAAQSVAATKAADPVPWLYIGSDIQPDPEWKFGVLPNGIRYAVRKNGVPPGQVSIRIGVEAGSLMENPGELGYAHFLEHLSFRGSRYVQDGEAKRVWQRLGATFGSDTNASTTTTQTIYKLDLPAVTAQGLDESLKILSGMMAAPSITVPEVDAERRTVMAEAREQFGPEFEANVATRKLFFAGQLFAERPPIGTVASLTAASSATLRAFHDRWYRPERTVIAIAGDVSPALLAQLVTKYFGDWKGKGPNPADPDFGKPGNQGPTAASVVANGLPLSINMAWTRPWVQKNDTIVYNQGKLVDLVATQLINRRLETAARAGGSYLQAQAQQDDVSRSVDGTFVQIVPIGEDWQAAVRDVRAVIADALINPPSQADITREANEFYQALQVGVETQRTEAGSKQADDLIEAVNIRETVATAEVARDVFTSLKDQITPAMVLASTKRLFSGVGPRALITGGKPIVGGDAALAAAIVAPVTARTAAAAGKPVSFAKLPALGKPGTVKTSRANPEIDLSYATFANGVNFVHFANPAESGKVYVAVRFGRGMQALPTNRQSVAWAAPQAMVASGIGPYGQDELDRLTSGRKINISFETADDAFVMRGQTRQADLADQLRLMATKLASPKWDAAPIARARASYLAGYDAYSSSPQGVLARDLNGLLRGSDPRWATPGRAEAGALNAKDFRTLWEPLLKNGPIEVMVFGDVTLDDARKAVAASFGAMKPRPEGAALSPQASGPRPTPKTLIRAHSGPADQAAAVLAWPTSGGIEATYESRKLDMLAQIFGDRMFDQLREAEGASYSPSVDSSWPTGFNSGGNFSVIAQLKPEGVARFFTISKGIAADMATKPVTADELARAINPMKERISRASTGSSFWLRYLEGSSTDPRRLAVLKTILADFSRITPAELQETARKWLKPDQAFELAVVPEAK
jgi:zinc protease